MTVHVRSVLRRARELFGHRPAVVGDGPVRTYADLADDAARLAGHLRGHGIGTMDRVAVLAPNVAEFVVAYFAAAQLDAILCPLNTRLAAPEVRAIVADSGARLLLAHGDAAALARDACADGGPPVLPLTRAAWQEAAPFASGAGAGGDQVAHLYYTSGTTGGAKGVMLTHRNVCAHALMAIAELGLGDGDRWLHAAPMFHLADAWATFAITWVGGVHVMLPRFSPEATLAAIAQHRVTATNLVPSMLHAVVRAAAGAELGSMRLVLSGGAPIAPDVVRQVIATFGDRCTYVQTYGMTETSPFLTMSLLDGETRALPFEQRLALQAKTGRPVLGVDLRVVGDGGRPVARDERAVGEIEVRGETVTPGYWNRPDADAEAFTADGWLRTGDLAVVDARGYVTIVDRRKDVILTGGETVYTTEVEAVLYAHPDVAEAAVFGVPDERWGERVAAAVVLRAGAAVDAAALQAFCRRSLGGFKVPREVRFLAALPRTGSGKIAKRLLRG